MAKKPLDKDVNSLFQRARNGDLDATDRLRQLLRESSSRLGALRVLGGLAATASNRPTLGEILDGALTEDDLRTYQRSLGNPRKIKRVDELLGALVAHQRQAGSAPPPRPDPGRVRREPIPDLDALESVLASLEDGRILVGRGHLSEPIDSLTLQCRSTTFRVSIDTGGFVVLFRNPERRQRLEELGWKRRGNGLVRRWADAPPSQVANGISDALRVMFRSSSNPRLKVDDELLPQWLEARFVLPESVLEEEPDFDGPDDPVFGTVRSAADLGAWFNEVRPAAFRHRALRLPPGAASGDGDLSWCHHFSRLNPTDAARLKASFAAVAKVQHPGQGPGTDLERLVREAALVYVPAPEAHDLFAAEALPRHWLRDVRLPFPMTTLCFSSLFEIPTTWTRSLPDGPCPPAVSSYRQWFSAFSAGGALLAVTLVAEEDGTLSELAVVHAAVLDQGQCTHAVNLPARLGATHLEGIVRPLAGWLSEPRFTESEPGVLVPSRTSLQRRNPSASRPEPTHGPSTIQLKAKAPSKRRRSSSTGSVRSAHVRRGHWRRQRIGPRTDWHYEIRWVSPAWVAGGNHLEAPRHVYVLPAPTTHASGKRRR